MNHDKVPLIVFHTTKTPLNFANIRKNGADQLIHFNFDREFIIELLLEVVPYEFPQGCIPLAALNSIDCSDLNAELEINFDVYVHLPFNKKTILYRKKGDKLEDQKIKKIENKDQHLYFKKTEKKQFLEYARTCMTFSTKENPIAETERALKSKKLIFEIMSEFFNQEVSDFEAGKAIFDRCREIVKEYDLLKTYSPKEAFEKVVKFTGQERTFYNEAINMAVYASMFGHILALPADQIEALALAGLLHNIGLSYLDNFELHKEISTLPKDQQELYYTYPDKSVLMIKGKKVPLPPLVADCIIEHRENMDGTGFPEKMSNRIRPLARVLRIAYEFQVMTALTKDQEKHTASSALIFLKENVMASKIPLDLNTVLSLAKVAKS
jgi:HD-GYP domain-containing protein (c-di-GMP phosphodiesterase class II)